MADIVYLLPTTNEPFTTSEVVAECAGVKHHAVQQMIRKYKDDFESFGVIAFEMRKPPAGSKGGKPQIVYHLNEPQATLLLTYLKNTPAVVTFKKELVRQFYAMRQELETIKATKKERQSIRTGMTDAIRALPDSPHKHLKYAQYTNLAYKAALGKTARQLRAERGADKRAAASDYMRAEEIAAVSNMENRIAVLLEVGMTYEQIKIGRAHV